MIGRVLCWLGRHDWSNCWVGDAEGEQWIWQQEWKSCNRCYKQWQGHVEYAVYIQKGSSSETVWVR